MKIKVFVVFLFIVPVCLFAQFTEYNSFFSDVFSDTPTADLKFSSSSNFKFGNQFYDKNSRKYIISSNCLSDLYGSRIYQTESNDSYEVYNSKLKISPEFSISYYYNEYMFQISNHISKFLNQKQTKGSVYSEGYLLGKMIFNISNRVFSFSIGKKLNPKIIASIGILTNNYINTFSFSEYEKKAKTQLNYFDQFQFMGSINYNMNSNNELYLLLKSQSPKNRIHSNIIYLPGYPDLPITSESVVTYTGLLSLGFQHRSQNNFRVAIEILNHYLYANEKHTIHYENFSSKFDFKHDLWNPEIVLEFSYKLKNLNLSFLYSCYFNYETELNEYSDAQRDYEVEAPQAMLISTSYQFSRHFKVFTSYQFSYMKTNYSNPAWFEEGEAVYKDAFHYIKCGLSYNFCR